ncbi:MAG: hypothetical protein EAZ85_16295 [Bacteroidetes bacterium]|nr:MAG: hypothetical protein EAZ85_16295 [Bacteroidota bacterium]TAG95368.1 MAG: hypothetical protein EAZ20_00315 [Bacteroidota bacterium]
MDKNDFLSQPEDIKTSYLVILAGISSADHQNTDAEIAFVEQMSTASGISADSKQIVTNALKDIKSADLPSHLAKFKTNDIKFALTSDLLNLGYADGTLSADETNAVKSVATELGISAEQFDALAQYVQTANKEATKTNGGIPAPQAGEPSFLEKIGLKSVFDKLGIPVGHFLTGTTIAATLGAVAYMMLQNYTKPNAQGSHTGTLGDTLGNWLGGLVGGTPAAGQPAGANAGMQGMISNFFTSEAGAATINNVINNVAQATSQGKGLGSLAEIVGGGIQQGMLQNVLGSLLGGAVKK